MRSVTAAAVTGNTRCSPHAACQQAGVNAYLTLLHSAAALTGRWFLTCSNAVPTVIESHGRNCTTLRARRLQSRPAGRTLHCASTPCCAGCTRTTVKRTTSPVSKRSYTVLQDCFGSASLSYQLQRSLARYKYAHGWLTHQSDCLLCWGRRWLVALERRELVEVWRARRGFVCSLLRNSRLRAACVSPVSCTLAGRNEEERACKASFRATHLETKSPWNQSPVIADCGYEGSVRR